MSYTIMPKSTWCCCTCICCYHPLNPGLTAVFTTFKLFKLQLVFTNILFCQTWNIYIPMFINNVCMYVSRIFTNLDLILLLKWYELKCDNFRHNMKHWTVRGKLSLLLYFIIITYIIIIIFQIKLNLCIEKV